jgi:hypothetical protein
VVKVEEQRKVRDPRFEGVGGGVDQGMLEKEYRFVGEQREQEEKELREMLKHATDQDEREALVEDIRLLRDQTMVIRKTGKAGKRFVTSGSLFRFRSRSSRTTS